LQIFDSTSGNAVSAIECGPTLEKAAFNRNGQLVVATLKQTSNPLERVVQVWSATTGEEFGRPLTVSNFTGVALSDDGKRLAVMCGRSAQVWDVAAHTAIISSLAHDGAIGSSFFNRDGTRLGTRSSGLIKVWDLGSGRELFFPLTPGAGFEFGHAEFSPDGNSLVTCCWNSQPDKGFAQIWDMASGRPKDFKFSHGDGVLFASFSPDGRQLVTASEDFTARIWDVASGQLLFTLQHENQVQTAVFSPDGKRVVTASSDKTARVWSAETGAPLTPPLRHLTPLFSAQFLPDGRSIVTGDKKGNVWIWALPSDQRPLEELARLAEVLSASKVASEQLSQSTAESLKRTWEQLRAVYPSDFSTSDEEIAAWHQRQADESEKSDEWFAVVFHLERLLALQPEDAALSNRLAAAKIHLSSNN
jgi:WD40 repeat protein